MKALPYLFLCAALSGCATDPLMSGKAEDWIGHKSSELRQAWGQPTKTTTKPDGSEVWEYSESGDFHSPESENTSFHFGGFGGGNAISGGGGISTVKNKEHLGNYQKLFRFSVNKDGKIKGWYAARIEDGRVVWEDH